MKITMRKPAASAITNGMTLAEVMALPVITDVVSAGRALGMGRTRSYELARAGSFPCRVVRVGKTYHVPTADLLALLGISMPRANSRGKNGGVGYWNPLNAPAWGADLGHESLVRSSLHF